MRVQLDSGEVIDLGTTATAPTIGIVDYSRLVTDDYGITTVVKRNFARRMSVQIAVPFSSVDAVQRRLADLRATSALWIADDRFASLTVRGFYKEFSIDVGTPTLSYCTLSVEGLTETDAIVDDGSDPAPVGQSSTLEAVQPVIVTDTQLAASNVVENDAPEWSANTAYPVGVRVIKAATHRIYESVAPIAAGDDPEGTSGKWLDVGPTNRWAMFDQALGSVTTGNRNVAVTIDAGAINAVALLDVDADTIRVQAIGYDRMMPARAGSITFLDLPANPGQVTVTIAGSGVVSIGTMLVGNRVALGVTEASPTAGITDFSKKVVDDFGEVTVVPRAWAKKMTANALIRTDAIDVVANRIAAVRATPSLWIGHDGLDSLTIYGFFKDFSIEVGESVSKLGLTIEGLSTAGKVAPLVASAAWPDITDPLGTKPADNADVTGDAYFDIAGRTIEQTTVEIDSLITKAADLETMYGDTANASASAALALAASHASQTAQSNAETAATATAAAMTSAIDAANAAGGASQSAQQSQALAATASDSARGSATAAEGNASSAAASVDAAGRSASSAQASATSASTFAGNAQGFAGQAATSASQASTSATTASGSANTASSFMQQAASSRDAAGGSAGAAASSASVAQSASDTASSAATSASTSANNAYSKYVGAVGQAQSASSSAASASASATAASQSATISASLSTSAINTNPDFNVWGNAAGLPDGWKFWTNADNTSRISGVLGRPYAVRQSPTANERLGFYMDSLRMTRGWNVLEARFRGYNSFSGAGVRFSGAGKSYDLNFATAPDVAGKVRGGAEYAGWSYNFSKLIYVTDEDYGAVLYAFTAYDGLGDISVQKQIDWDHVAVRAATDGEIMAQRADGNSTTALAQIATNASAQASQNAAQAIVNTNVNATLNSQAAINTSVSQSIANNYAAASQQISTLSAYAATNQNYAPALSSWSTAGGYSLLTSANSPGWTWGTAVVGSLVAGNELALAQTGPIYMTPNQNATFSCDLLCFGDGNQYVRLNILTFDNNGNMIDDNRGPDCRIANFSDSRPRSAYSVTAYLGSNIAYCQLRILARNASSANNPAGFRRPKFEAGGIATAYTEEGASASLSASVQVLQQTTADVQRRISTAVFQVLAQAGTSLALLKLTADGYGASQIALVANSIRLFAQSDDDPTKAIEALTVRSDGRVDIPNLMTNFSVVPAFGYFNGPIYGTGADPGTSGGNAPTPIRDPRRLPGQSTE